MQSGFELFPARRPLDEQARRIGPLIFWAKIFWATIFWARTFWARTFGPTIGVLGRGGNFWHYYGLRF
jgi:hypothetical protein